MVLRSTTFLDPSAFSGRNPNCCSCSYSWWYGFGLPYSGQIHDFRLYNVSGFDAVELRLKSGDVYRLGTDDPEGFSVALKGR